jgi:hypothetical protein
MSEEWFRGVRLISWEQINRDLSTHNTPRKQPVPKPYVAPVSQIGNTLVDFFSTGIGAIPCGECKAEILRLNRMTASEVSADRAAIIDRIEKNSRTADSRWYARLAAMADELITGGEVKKLLIGRWLDEAVEKEIQTRSVSSG